MRAQASRKKNPVISKTKYLVIGRENWRKQKKKQPRHTHAKSKHNKKNIKENKKTVEGRKSNNTSNKHKPDKRKQNTNKQTKKKDTLNTLSQNTYRTPSQQHRIDTHTYTYTLQNKNRKTTKQQ